MRYVLLVLMGAGMAWGVDTTLLHAPKQKLLETQREAVLLNALKNELGILNPLSFSLSQSQAQGASSDNISDTTAWSLSWSQDIFRSGGIYFAWDATERSKIYNLHAVDIDAATQMSTLFALVLQLQRNALELAQSDYTVANRTIEVTLNRLRYEAGEIDITVLNNSIMDKNSAQKSRLALAQTLAQNKEELAKLTPKSYESITLPRFVKPDLSHYVQNNLVYLRENLNAQTAQSNAAVTLTSYLPKIALSASYGYQNVRSDSALATYDGNTYSMGITASIPLAANSLTAVQEAQVNVLKAKASADVQKIEAGAKYAQAMRTIDYYEGRKAIAQENIALYEELMKVTQIEAKSGYKTQYDIDILQNSRAIEALELQINEINIQIEWTKLYFATKEQS
ncbi:MAG: hypothetical protein KU37_03325 [Sulfuricurvum sp. PC08-66]|nr:MAG: hypothetical protein KU37_03325 [Sulfuricurvum sp. PC08-66]